MKTMLKIVFYYFFPALYIKLSVLIVVAYIFRYHVYILHISFDMFDQFSYFCNQICSCIIVNEYIYTCICIIVYLIKYIFAPFLSAVNVLENKLLLS